MSLRKPLGEASSHFANLEKYSFIQVGQAHHRRILPARMACAAPVVGLFIGGKDPSNLIFVPPVSPTAGGNCEGIPEKHRELFFAEEGKETLRDSPARRDYLWGHYCHDCPVREACFEYAVNYIDWGIWAGTTEAERKRLRGKLQESDTPKTLSKRAEQAIIEGKKRLRRGIKPLD